jgi:hypothetical protein
VERLKEKYQFFDTFLWIACSRALTGNVGYGNAEMNERGTSTGEQRAAEPPGGIPGQRPGTRSKKIKNRPRNTRKQTRNTRNTSKQFTAQIQTVFTVNKRLPNIRKSYKDFSSQYFFSLRPLRSLRLFFVFYAIKHLIETILLSDQHHPPDRSNALGGELVKLDAAGAVKEKRVKGKKSEKKDEKIWGLLGSDDGKGIAPEGDRGDLESAIGPGESGHRRRWPAAP